VLKITRDKERQRERKRERKRERGRKRFVKCKIIILISHKHLFFYPSKCFHLARDVSRLKRLVSFQDPEAHISDRVAIGRASLAGQRSKMKNQIKKSTWSS